MNVSIKILFSLLLLVPSVQAGWGSKALLALNSVLGIANIAVTTSQTERILKRMKSMNKALRRIECGTTDVQNAVIDNDLKALAQALDKGDDPNEACKNGWRALDYAVMMDRIDSLSILLRYGADRELVASKDSMTPIHRAAHLGNRSAMKILVYSNRFDECLRLLNLEGKDGNTPLFCAVLNNQKHMYTWLVVQGADMLHQSENGSTLLHCAAQVGNKKIMNKLMNNGMDSDVVDAQGRTPLFSAAAAGQRKAVNYLINRGSDIDHLDAHGRTPLHEAVSCVRYPTVAKLLFRGAQTEACDERGESVMHYAANCRNRKIIKKLLKYGGSVTFADEHGQTPLHTAAQKGNDCLVCRSVTKENIDIRNVLGETPLHCASQKGHYFTVKRLIKRGAGVREQNNNGESALFYACSANNEKVVRRLLGKGAAVNAANGDKETPLHHAVARGRVGIAKRLIAKGADLTAVNNDLCTPLHIAAGKKYVRLTRILLKAATKDSIPLSQFVNAQDASGKTAAHYASQGGNVITIKELRKFGADFSLLDKGNCTVLALCDESKQAVIKRALGVRG